MVDLQDKKDLVAVDNDEYHEPSEGHSEDSESDEEAREDTSSDVDSEEERRRYFCFFTRCPVLSMIILFLC